MKKYNIKVNGKTYEVEVEETGSVSEPVPQVTSVVRKEEPVANNEPAKAADGALSIKAPMPGNIVKVNVKNGDKAKKGDVLLVLEAMKMENDITAPQDLTVANVAVTSGKQVNTGEVLLTYN